MKTPEHHYDYSKAPKLPKEKAKCNVNGCFIKRIDGSKWCKSHTSQILKPKKPNYNSWNKFKSIPKKKTPKKIGGKRKPQTYTNGEKQTWKLFSQVIRLRDTDAYGKGRCINTGKEIYYYLQIVNGKEKSSSNCDAGHFFTRAYKNIIFDFRNVHAEIASQNRYKGEDKVGYKQNLLQKIGITEFKDLEKNAHEWKTPKGKRPTVEWMKGFRIMLKEMKKELLKTKRYG